MTDIQPNRSALEMNRADSEGIDVVCNVNLVRVNYLFYTYQLQVPSIKASLGGRRFWFNHILLPLGFDITKNFHCLGQMID